LTLTVPATATLGAKFTLVVTATSGTLPATDAAVITDIVYVADLHSPVLHLPTTKTVEATSPAGAVVTYTVTAMDTVDPEPGVSCTPVSGAIFPLGRTQVTCTATDTAGHQTQGSFDVNVVDTLHPSSSVSSPGYVKGGAITVTWVAADIASGVDVVELWVRYEDDLWKQTALTGQGDQGTFIYTPTLGSGDYAFAALATDRAGNREGAAPTTPESTTIYEAIIWRTYLPLVAQNHGMQNRQSTVFHWGTFR
jgi:hypothetical protein